MTLRRMVSTLAVFAAIAGLAILSPAWPVVAGGPDVTVINTSANPVPVTVGNLPAVQNVNVTNSSLPVTVQRALEHDGMFFSVTKLADPDPVLTVPAGVVLTDAHVTFSIPENFPNAASLLISDGSRFFVYQLVNNTTFHAGVDLGSGIMSNGSLTVQLSCYNIVGNHCQGAIMWSGYRP